jgi:hypothetical protein
MLLDYTELGAFAYHHEGLDHLLFLLVCSRDGLAVRALDTHDILDRAYSR